MYSLFSVNKRKITTESFPTFNLKLTFNKVSLMYILVVRLKDEELTYTSLPQILIYLTYLNSLLNKN